MAKKLGLCLTGGGARGSYQVGALKALEELDILASVKVYSGTSIGAANAAIVASTSVKRLIEVWMDLAEDDIPKNDAPFIVKKDGRRNTLNFERGIYSMRAFEKLLLEAIDFERLKDQEVYATISHGGAKDEGLFQVFKSSYAQRFKKEGKGYYMPLNAFDKEKVQKIIVASCSIPFFFAPVLLEERKYYDGGMFDNMPYTPLVECGCDEVIIVHLHKYRFSQPKHEAEGVKFHDIMPLKSALGRVMKFSKANSEKLYQLGYEDTLAYFKALRKDIFEGLKNH